MQEFKYFRDGATLVISLDGLNWLSRGRNCDKTIKKRDEELQLLMSSSQTIQAEERLQPITCFCFLDQRGRAAPQLWRNSDRRSSLVTRPPSVSISPRRRCLPEAPAHYTSSASLFSECPQEAWTWTRLTLNLQDIFSFIKKDTPFVSEQHVVKMDRHDRFLLFCDDDVPLQRFRDICQRGDCKTFKGETGCHISDNVLSDLKNSDVNWPQDPSSINTNANNSKGIQHEQVIRDPVNTQNPKGVLKACRICNASGVSSGRDRDVNRRKSVSFVDDVTMYLFDQESPTVKLHHGPCTSPPSSHSFNLPDATLQDSDLEWEDDFSALDKNCNFQCVRQAESNRCPVSLPSRSFTSLTRPERLCLPQSCLFLTHVTESDLEL